jgi:hypothetical protein
VENDIASNPLVHYYLHYGLTVASATVEALHLRTNENKRRLFWRISYFPTEHLDENFYF